ncbi:MAG: hypothetical protein HYW57_07195 [Ignavibacteriales bacterium]|nr:hypothetical protein [Ignavibacteriales bacterium]
MIIGVGKHRYRWIDRWAVVPDTPSAQKNGRTHGVAVAESGNVLVFHQANPAVLVFDRDGRIRDAWGERFPGAHGMTLVREEEEFLWLTDQDTAEVVKTTLDGRVVQSLRKPEHEAYTDGKYSPTWVAVSETRFGGNGDIWVADGYGSNLLHRYDEKGRYLGSVSGVEGEAGAFNCPHGIMFDYRTGKPELTIADRGNKRLQVYDQDGKYRRTFQDGISCPCASTIVGSDLVVPELNAKLTVLSRENRFVCHLGDNEQTTGMKGWPDHPQKLLVPGKFNSPHSVAADAGGNLYVVEWIIGGRITKLEKLAA